MALLFKNTVPNINIHIKSIYREKELQKKATIKDSLIVQREGNRLVNRKVVLYNLDVIISVGYRIKSKRGTQFRQWATERLRDHLVKGYSLNEKRLQQVTENLRQLEKAIRLIQQPGNNKELSTNEAKGLLDIIANYTRSFILLNQFDSNTFPEEKLSGYITYEIGYKEAVKAIGELKQKLTEKKEASGLFGIERDKTFAGVLNAVVQTFDGKYLYKTIEEQAAHLLYFVIKNHPFTDGNKRLALFFLSGSLRRINAGLKNPAS